MLRILYSTLSIPSYFFLYIEIDLIRDLSGKGNESQAFLLSNLISNAFVSYL